MTLPRRPEGALPEVARDNMGHSEIPMTLEGYSRTWCDERRSAVSAVVDMVMNSNDNQQQQKEIGERRMLFQPESEDCVMAPQVTPLHQKWCNLNS